MCPKYCTCAQNLTFRNSSRDSEDSLDSGDSPEIVQTRPVRPWVLHAPGAKMTVVYTNSLKQEFHSNPGLKFESKN